MEWNIITASKGGVGKTLTTLLLLAYHLEHETNEGILVLDLNAMNTDTTAMLIHGNNDAKFTMIELPQSKRKIRLQSAISGNKCFAVACPTNPFLLYGHDNFAELLFSIKENAKTIAEELEINELKYVIIDTNYHFCNLFPPQDELYDEEHGEYWINLRNDKVTIWFIWVYRQLQKILGERINLIGNSASIEQQIKQQIKEQSASEITIVNRTVGAIERLFNKPEAKGNKRIIGPIVHAYTPVGLSPIDNDDDGFFAKLFAKKNSSQERPIQDLVKLENLKRTGQYVEFSQWKQKLLGAERSTAEQYDTHRQFGKVLCEAVHKITGDDDELPVNIFPLSLYEMALVGYTDRERKDTVEKLRELETYKKFKKLLNRKYYYGDDDT